MALQKIQKPHRRQSDLKAQTHSPFRGDITKVLEPVSNDWS